MAKTQAVVLENDQKDRRARAVVASEGKVCPDHTAFRYRERGCVEKDCYAKAIAETPKATKDELIVRVYELLGGLVLPEGVTAVELTLEKRHKETMDRLRKEKEEQIAKAKERQKSKTVLLRKAGKESVVEDNADIEDEEEGFTTPDIEFRAKAVASKA